MSLKAPLYKIVLERSASFQHYYLMQVYPPVPLTVTFFLPIAFLSPETNSGNKNSRPSHGLLPSLFFFVIVLGMALGDFLLLLLA